MPSAILILDPSSHLVAVDMGRKLEGTLPPFLEGASPHLTQCRLGRGLPL